MEEVKEQSVISDNNMQVSKKRRFWELDFLRGICVILMVFDHFMYTMGFIMPGIGKSFGTDMWSGAHNYVLNVYWNGGLRSFGHVVVVIIFFMLCGISCTFSRSNVKRGFLCFLVGCGITFFTVVAGIIYPDLEGEITIYFGVLHMLGLSMLLYGLFDWLGSLIAKIGKEDKTKKVTKIIGDFLAPTIGLILLIVYIACFYDGNAFSSNVVVDDRSKSVLASLFIYVDSISIGGADYWPLLPWAAIVLVGGAIGRGIYHNDKTKNYLTKLDGKWNKPVCFVGRNALKVYVVHQVVVFVVLFLITLFASIGG